MAGGVPPDPAQGAELVHVATRTQVTRLSVGDTQVVRKQPLGPDARQRLEHERAMLKRLRGVRGVAQLLDAPQYPGSIVMADAGETTLADRAKPLPVDELLELAVELARAVAGMHHRGVMHRDITPANVVVSVDGVPTLVDFALATSLAETRPEFTHHSQILGTLAYLAPEQTGRTGRSVDQRADLYALGATLYELATGAPPFGFGDPLRLTHDHLARVPVPPAQVDPAVPEPFSAIVMHLLEKEPDNRYQTAEGVVHDLERLRDGGTGLRTGRAAGRRAGRPAAVAAAVVAGGPRRRGGGAAGGVRGRACRRVPGRADRRGAGGGQDGAGRPAAAGGDRQGRLVRGRQVRPVPPGSRVRRGPPGVPRAGSAAACRAGGRAGPGPRPDASGARTERRHGRRPDPRVRQAACRAARPRRPADRAGAGGAHRPGDPARDRVTPAADGVLRRRPAVGRQHPARLVRPPAGRRTDQRVAVGRCLPR